MIKRMTFIMSALLILLSGCGNNSERVIEGDVQTIGQGSTQTDTQTGETTESASEQPEDAGSDTVQTSEKGYVFQFNDISVVMDADAAPIVEKLGEPASYFEAASCAFEGLDKMYTYNGFEIDTYPDGDKDYVSSVILKDDSVATAEGIYIGDSLEKLQQTYGEAKESGGMYIYEKDGMKLCFILRDQDIIAIEYRSTVLEVNDNEG